MQPLNFKDFDKRKFHVRNIEDVIDWLQYQASRNEEAAAVLRSYRTSYNVTKSIMRAAQADLERANRKTNVVTNPVSEVKIEEVKPVEKDKEAIVEELKAAIEAENTLEAREEEGLPVTPEEQVKLEQTEDKISDSGLEEYDALAVVVDGEKYSIERNGIGFTNIRREGKITAKKNVSPTIIAALEAKLEKYEAEVERQKAFNKELEEKNPLEDN